MPGDRQSSPDEQRWPSEAVDEAVNYDELVATLRGLAGEEVRVAVDPAETYAVEVFGQLATTRVDDRERTIFQVGEEGYLTLRRASFVSATRSAFDGGCYFWIKIRTTAVNLEIHDRET